MTLIHRVASVVRWFARRDREELQLDDDLRHFIEASVAEKIRDGVSPAEARRLAVLELGGVEQVKEQVRRRRHGGWLDEFWRDSRYAVRMFAGHPGFTSVIALTLALGIGANAAIFSLIDALMLRWLPVRDPQELVLVNARGPNDARAGETFSYAIVKALAAQRDIFAGVGGFTGMPFEVGAAGSVARISGALVTGGFYETLGLNPIAGRLLTDDDDREGAPPVAAISYGYWERQFNRDPNAIGRTILVGDSPVTVVGVSPRGFVGANVGQIADITMPVAAIAQVNPPMAPLLGKGNFWLRALARPASSVSADQARSRFNFLWPRIADDVIAPHWPASRRKEMAAMTFEFSRGGTGWTFLREMYARPLMVLMAMVGLVLLISCANVASLLLARASARAREIGVRLAIGASRGRVVRQLLIESALLSFAGAALGIGLAWASGRFLIALISGGPLQIEFDLTPNWHLLAFTTAIAVATAIIFGVAPAVQATAAPPSAALRADARMSAPRSRILPWLVGGQVALSLVLLIGAGLFVRTLRNLQGLDPGFKREGVLLVNLEGRRDPIPADLLDEVRSLPGVDSASVSTHTPLSGATWSEPAVPSDQPLPERDNAIFVGAGPRFFETLQIRIVAGREFTDRDSASSPAVAIVNEAYARQHFAGRSPLGEHLLATVRGQRRDLTIVGLAKDMRTRSLRAAPRPTVYVAYAQLAGDIPTNFEIRAVGNLGHVASAVQRAIAARLSKTLVEVRPLSSQVERSMVQERMMAALATAFGVLALMLACLGLYGLLAYTVTRRTRELGIRLALGAQRRRLVGLVLSGATGPVLTGIIVGLPAAWAATRWIESMLFGLKATDPWTLGGALVLLLASAQLAAFLPARRASRVDPLSALRHE